MFGENSASVIPLWCELWSL